MDLRTEPLTNQAVVNARHVANAPPAATARPTAVALVACLIAFAWLCLEVARDNTRTVDDSILAWVAGRRSPVLTVIATDLTALGSPTLLTLAAVLVTAGLWASGRRLVSVQTAAACSAAALVTNATKILLARPRPPLAGHLLGVTGFSFPSGHASGIAALLTVTALHTIEAAPSRGRRLFLAAVHAALILGVGWSRVYLGVHHASDVLAGICVGVACALGVHTLVRGPAIARHLSGRHR